MDLDRNAVLEMYVQYLPESSEINYWMFAMIALGMAFIAFVVASIYLICSDEKSRTLRQVARTATVTSRVNVPLENGARWPASRSPNDDSAEETQLSGSAGPPLT
ncbi:uncharacterized protein LOC122368645 [Amphibalanus amphitrite]|uniref:uncharacterized protein LOC122368161 n=1 Tax=Amphibalanus amphitrite TaxID=1232801 RepID=UPI001C913F52|nr:uncharacterized protein LOC122368161 [Amphibalanus amphitrite]XP_043198734.1 uncharacterized protein LOC122368645 [Amphibalanus amphitrite]